MKFDTLSSLVLISGMALIVACDNSMTVTAESGECNDVDIVVKVGNVALPYNRLEQLCKYEYNAAKLSMSGNSDKQWEKRFYTMVTNAVIARFRVDEMVNADAENRGLAVAPSALIDKVKSQYRQRFRKMNGDFESIKGKFLEAGDGEAFEYYFNNKVTMENYLQTYYGEELRVSEDDITAEIDGATRINVEIAKTNAYFAVVATNAWQQLQLGVPFAEVHDKFSTEDEEDWVKGGLLEGPLTRTDFEDMQESWSVIQKLKVGETTPLLENEYGYFFYRLEGDAEYEENGELSSAKFSRIWIRKAMPAYVFNRKETRKLLEKNFRNNVMRKIFEELSKKYEFVCLRPDIFTLNKNPNKSVTPAQK